MTPKQIAAILALLLALSVAGSLALNRWATDGSRAVATVQSELDSLQHEKDRLENEPAEAGEENEQLNETPAVAEDRPSTPRGIEPASPAVAAQMAVLGPIQESTEQIRGLTPRSTVPMEILGRAGLRRLIIQNFDREYPPEERRRDQKLYKTLGFLEGDEDVAEAMVDLLTQEIAGMYDSEVRRLYVISDSGRLSAGEKITFAHEYTHALQDQHFDLEKLLPDRSENSDREMAIRALVEGDATLVMESWAEQGLTAQEYQRFSDLERERLRRAPHAVREKRRFPYEQGLIFVRRLQERGGSEAVNEAFRNPPSSTSQIIHPERYFRREEPVKVSLPDVGAALGPEWRVTETNVMGELDTRILLHLYLGPSFAISVAGGWAGDSYVFAEGPDDRVALVWKTVWRARSDATDFFEGYRRTIDRRFRRTAEPLENRTGLVQWRTEDYHIHLAQGDRETLVVIASEPEAMRQVVDAVGPLGR